MNSIVKVSEALIGARRTSQLSPLEMLTDHSLFARQGFDRFQRIPSHDG